MGFKANHKSIQQFGEELNGLVGDSREAESYTEKWLSFGYSEGRMFIAAVEAAENAKLIRVYLSKIERGERDVRRLDVISDVARALRVTVADLFGQPVLMEDDEDHDDIPAVRDALMSPRRLSRTLFGTAAPPVNVNPSASVHFVEQAWDSYQSGYLGRAVSSLSGLVETAQQLEDAANASEGDVQAC
ncbi:hypothetical protein GCM10027174_25310 [Salinifilum aidingensis]